MGHEKFCRQFCFFNVATVHLVQCLIHIFNVFVVLELTELAVTIG